MGGKSGGSNPQINSAGMPEWAQGAHTDLMARAKTESMGQYNPYQGTRVAGESGTSGQGRTAIQGMLGGSNVNMDQGIQGFQGLQSGTNANINAGANTTGTAIGHAQNFDNYNQGEYARFDDAAAQRYMSPYQQNVTDVAKRNAIGDYQRANIDRNSNLVSQGAFGGSRQAIIQSEADRNLSQQLSDLQVQGSQDAFTNAQQQFGADRGANADAFAANAGVDQARVEAMMRGGDQLASIGSNVYDNQMKAAGSLYESGRDIYGNASDAANTMYRMGKDEEGRDQAQLDAEYGDYLTDRDWSKNQMGWYSGIMTGAAPGFTNYTGETRNSGAAANLLGLGTAAVGAIGKANE